jgi:hypothetical protein
MKRRQASILAGDARSGGQVKPPGGPESDHVPGREMPAQSLCCEFWHGTGKDSALSRTLRDTRPGQLGTPKNMPDSTTPVKVVPPVGGSTLTGVAPSGRSRAGATRCPTPGPRLYPQKPPPAARTSGPWTRRWIDKRHGPLDTTGDRGDMRRPLQVLGLLT